MGADVASNHRESAIVMKSRTVPVVLALVSALTALPAAADSGLFLNLPPVKGLSTDETHKGWLDIDSLQWSVGVGVRRNTSDSEVSIPSASSIVWSQSLDSTYPQLLQRLVAAPGGSAQFDVVLPSSQRSTPFLSLSTTGSAVDGVSFGNGSVSGSLAYSTITMTWDPKGQGGTGDAISTTLDLARNTVSGPTSLAPTHAVGAGGSTSASGIYMRLGSGASAIAGGATAVGYENWFALDSAQAGAGRGVSTVGGRTIAGPPSFSELTVTGLVGPALPVVFSVLAQGRMIPEVTLEYVMGGAAGPVTFMQMYMQDVYLSNLSISTGGGGAVSYSESLSFGKFSQTVWEINPDGTRGEASSFGYDAEKGKSITAELAPALAGFGAGGLSPLAAIGAPPGAVTPVPEPGQWALMLAGLGLLASLVRRRRAG
ncbi:MAG: type VI secretion system tube protein Hcp [Burkholderiaceae bacterium]|nr:type VI secretion system tube protein Hcp [Rhodoferax sp.]MCB2028510.1 type VI secretion system tube protein Hcp [Rhodoferax sp.]MCB2042302.1 type VI secretion system tube protein Hcp [Rhodoferax sp.]MCP5262119.1 type VI secretion system tube protein Hcp [Rhodoferax sp.]